MSTCFACNYDCPLRHQTFKAGICTPLCKHSIPIATAKSTINWDICNKAISDLKFHDWRWLVKHAAGHFRNGTCLKRWRYHEDDECPLCNQPKTPLHKITCTDPCSLSVWQETLLKIEAWLAKSNKHPDITKFLLQCLHSWHNGQPSHPISSNDLNIHSTFAIAKMQ
jgi:hypothetical protein